MSRLDDFIDQLGRIQDGDPWFGPAILAVLDGLSAKDAAAHPIPGAHSIWELVLHMTGWVNEVRRRLAEHDWRMPAEGDWPTTPDPTEANWRKAVTAIAEAHAALGAALRSTPEALLDQQLGGERNPALGSGQTYSQMLHGILQHDAYHLGQVSLLRKCLARAAG